MLWKCKNDECKNEIEYDEKELAKKGNPVCPKCDDDMESLTEYPFVVFSGDDRVVHEFTVNAIDEDEADNLALNEFNYFVDDLRYEMQ